MIKKWIALGIMLLFLCSSIPLLAYSDDKTYSSTSNGNWLYVGGSGPGNYTSIQAAINAASNGDTIYVYHKTYHEIINVNKSVHLIGENKTNTILDGTDFTIDLLEVSADDVTIQGFTIGYCNFNGIWSHANHTIIHDCTFINNRQSMIIEGSRNNTIISWCEFLSSSGSNYIELMGPRNTIINYCDFNSPAYIRIEYTTNTIISNCAFHNKSRVTTHYSTNIHFLNCTMQGDSVIPNPIWLYKVNGITIRDCSIQDYQAEGIRIEDYTTGAVDISNCTVNNCEFGIGFLGNAANTRITDCIITNHSVEGIYLVGGLRNVTITRCVIADNTDGVAFASASIGNTFTQNNFINNHKHIVQELGRYVMLNNFNDNYWDTWRGILPWYHVHGLFNWDFSPEPEPYDYH